MKNNIDISIIVPAFNEEKHLGKCLKSVINAFGNINRSKNNLKYEIIVSNNNSTDKTAEIAHKYNTKMVFEPVNQISRSRNKGAQVANGKWLLFIDADSVLNPLSLLDMLKKINKKNCAGGGSIIDINPCPLWAKPSILIWNSFSKIFKCSAGSFIFCRRDIFNKINGFSNKYFAAEEVDFSKRLNQYANNNNLKCYILKKCSHLSSGRKFELYSKFEIFKLLFNSFFRPVSTIANTSKLDFFYDGRR